MVLTLLNRSIEWENRHEMIEQRDENEGLGISCLVDINAKNNYGETSVTLAIKSRNMELLLRLLEKNANLDGAVYFTLEELRHKEDSRLREEFVLVLLEAGANILKATKGHKEF